eukprot:6287569-Pyramimonas_sp.AAC.1
MPGRSVPVQETAESSRRALAEVFGPLPLLLLRPRGCGRHAGRARAELGRTFVAPERGPEPSASFPRSPHPGEARR